MKLFKWLGAASVFVVSSANAEVPSTEMFVGSSPWNDSRVSLDYQYASTEAFGQFTEDGDISLLNLQLGLNMNEDLVVFGSIPLSMASGQTTDSSQDIRAGNLNLGARYFLPFFSNSVNNRTLIREYDDDEYEYVGSQFQQKALMWVEARQYLATSNSDRNLVAAYTSPTLRFDEYYPYTYSTVGGVGFAYKGPVTAKINGGAAWHHVSRRSFADGKENRLSARLQAGLSVQPIDPMTVKLEYASLYTDDKSSVDGGSHHSLIPGIGAEILGAQAEIYSNIPLDSGTREVNEIALGAKIAYAF